MCADILRQAGSRDRVTTFRVACRLVVAVPTLEDGDDPAWATDGGHAHELLGGPFKVRRAQVESDRKSVV